MKNISRGIYRIFETIFYDEFYMNFLLRFFFLLSFFSFCCFSDRIILSS